MSPIVKNKDLKICFLYLVVVLLFFAGFAEIKCSRIDDK